MATESVAPPTAPLEAAGAAAGAVAGLARPRLKLATPAPGWPGELGSLYELQLPGVTGAWRRAMQLEPRHCDESGQISTSVLLAFLDQVLVRAIDAVLRPEQHAQLLQLNTQFVGTTRPLRWLYGEALLLKQTRHVLFASAELFDDQQQLMVAMGTWRLAIRS